MARDITFQALKQAVSDNCRQRHQHRALNHIGGIKALSPIIIGDPSVLAPTVEAIVAVPILIITDVLMPASMTGAASGNSTFRSICPRLMPIPSAISRADSGTAPIPASVPCKIGKQPVNHQRDDRRLLSEPHHRHRHG
ncbi:Uncharacterised protein [Cedecea neteri]|uniref:Uncharacterized protein n=1 Tax=Cedecea neteri TaxID=158822 RepID=A0A2X2T299_9ENTR|nr:Uncharacterised protein [Cedecea neteri]